MKVKPDNIKSFFRRVLRFGPLLPISNLFLTYFGHRVPYHISKWISDWRHRRIESKIMSIVGVLPKHEDVESSPIRYDVDESVWVLWLQGEDQMPEIVKVCFESIRRNSVGRNVVLLSWDNLEEYIHISDRIKALYDRGVITSAHLSDIIRMELLSCYGGFWIDATMYLAKPLCREAFEMPLFTLKDYPHKDFFVSDYRWAGFFFSMRKGSELAIIASWVFKHYWEKESCLIDYFMIDYVIDIVYKNYSKTRKEIDSIPYNNPDAHNLTPLLCDKYDRTFFNSLLKRTGYFKLSWKAFSAEQLNATEGCYYSMLKS